MPSKRSKTWVHRVKVYPDESLGYYLGRFRRANVLSHGAIAEHLGIDVRWVRAWEMPAWRRNPTSLELIALSKLVEVAPERLAKMFPLEPLYEPPRLCVACYVEEPIHRIVWQQVGVDQCEIHKTPLLSACPACGTGFYLPAIWDNPYCGQCGLGYEEM